MPAIQWLRRWGPRLGGVVGAQGIVQGCNALSGLLAVWFLQRESAYAWFTVASSMMIMVTCLSDSGISAAVQAVGGPLWQDRTRFSRAVGAVLRAQHWLVAGACLVVIPWMTVLLVRLQAPVWSMVTAAVLVTVFAWPAASAQIWSHVNRLQQRLRPQLMAEIGSAASRFVLTVISLGSLAFLAHGTLASVPAAAFLGVLACACVASFILYHLVRREAAVWVDEHELGAHEFDSAVRVVVAGSAAFMIYYGLQAQVSTWLISFHGTTAGVADVGALGRLGVLFGLAGAPVVQLAAPAFARCAGRAALLRQLLTVCGLYALFSSIVVAAVTVMPGPVLWLLGPQYSHLGFELRLAALMPAVTGLCGIVWGLVLARGWVRSSALVVPVGLAAQLAAALFLDLSTVAGVLSFNLFILLPVLGLGAFIIWRRFVAWPSDS